MKKTEGSNFREGAINDRNEIELTGNVVIFGLTNCGLAKQRVLR